uniref:Uncharacterized protein n=1 Tax=Schizaphis graminum TaxID=13262 RepID=A0A2S2PKT3_SCHGA
MRSASAVAVVMARETVFIFINIIMPTRAFFTVVSLIVFFCHPLPPPRFVGNELINGQRRVVRRFIDGPEELNVTCYYFVRVWARVVDLALYGRRRRQPATCDVYRNERLYDNHCAAFTRTIIIL